MKYVLFRVCTMVLCVGSMISPCLSRVNDQVPGLGSPEVIELAENVLAVTGLYHSAEGGFTVNAGIVFTDQGVVFIDSGMSIASGEFLWEIARKRMKGGEDVYLILTHHHSDHVFGMHAIKERGAKVIAHKITGMWFRRMSGEQYKKFLAERDDWSPEKADRVYGNVVLSEPDRAIDQDTVVNIDGEEIHVLVTPGHVPSEISVYHPRSKTLFAGDTIYEGSELTTRFGGLVEWKQWISQLERLNKLEISTIVPGHGKLCGEEEIDRNIEFLKKKINKRKNS